MRGASRESLAQLLELLEPRLGAQDSRGIGEQLLVAVSALDSSAALRRWLADSAVEEDTKSALLDELFASALSQQALDLFKAAIARRWASAQDFVSGVEHLAVTALAASSADAGRLAETEEQLFGFAQAVTDSHELQRALSNHDAEPEAKRVLAGDLVAGKVSPEAEALIKQAAAHPRGTTTAEALAAYGRIVAARSSRSVAEVTVAAPLTAPQEQALGAKLARAYGRELALNVQIDPAVLGGVRVKVGDEVIDDTVVARLADVRRKIAG